MKKTGARQTYRSVMRRKSKIALLTIILIIVVLALAAILVSTLIKYSPPAQEAAAEKGEPTVSEEYLYREISTDFGYSFSMASNLYQQEDGSLNIFLTNPAKNEVHILCEIRDRDSKSVYYKSGRLLPGEYVRNLKPQTDISNELHNVDVVIYAFEPEKYLSAGTTDLKLVLQAW